MRLKPPLNFLCSESYGHLFLFSYIKSIANKVLFLLFSRLLFCLFSFCSFSRTLLLFFIRKCQTLVQKPIPVPPRTVYCVSGVVIAWSLCSTHQKSWAGGAMLWEGNFWHLAPGSSCQKAPKVLNGLLDPWESCFIWSGNRLQEKRRLRREVRGRVASHGCRVMKWLWSSDLARLQFNVRGFTGSEQQATSLGAGGGIWLVQWNDSEETKNTKRPQRDEKWGLSSPNPSTFVVIIQYSSYSWSRSICSSVAGLLLLSFIFKTISRCVVVKVGVLIHGFPGWMRWTLIQVYILQ